MKYIDLSHEFVDAMPVFPGDPATTLKQITAISKEGYTDHQLTTVMHVGTHMDAPLHMVEGGKYMSEIPVDRFAGAGIVVDVRGKKEIDHNVLSGVSMPNEAIVLLHTGLSSIYGTEQYTKDYPKITESFAQALVEAKVKILGMDMINPDTEESFPIHKILLSHEILIIENLTNIEALVNQKDFEVFAFPIKLHADAASVRVVARVS
jgi:kynurenine formamidase